MHNVLGYPIHVFLPPQRVVVVSLLPEWLHSAQTVAVAGNLLELFHEAEEASVITSLDQQVKVVRHEAVREDIHVVVAGCLR